MSSLRQTLIRAGAIATLATGIAAGSATAASAQAVHHDDAKADVVRFDNSSETATPSPETTNGDITHVTLYHSAHRVGARVAFTDLTRTGDFRVDLLDIKTNEGVYREVVNFGMSGSWKGQAELDKPNGDKVRCSVSHSVDFTANVVKLSVPRSCLSKPRWVKLGFATLTDDTSGNSYADDALETGIPSDSQGPVMTRRLYRG